MQCLGRARQQTSSSWILAILRKGKSLIRITKNKDTKQYLKYSKKHEFGLCTPLVCFNNYPMVAKNLTK